MRKNSIHSFIHPSFVASLYLLLFVVVVVNDVVDLMAAYWPWIYLCCVCMYRV